MNKLLLVLFASAFAFGTALAQDSSLMPLSKMDTQEAKAAREAAKAKWDAMTPQQKAEAKKVANKKRLADANAIDELANEFGYTPPTKAEQAASKAVPKPTKEQRQKALQEQEKKASQ
jgi:hypothetical protein